MPRLALAPTKSNLLELRRQLALALEGFDLLDQKRQILALELLRRLGPAEAAEARAQQAAADAVQRLREALLDAGSAGVDRAAAAAPPGPAVLLGSQRLMGLMLPRVLKAPASPSPPHPGVPDTLPPGPHPHRLEAARRAFTDLLPELARLGEQATALLRLAAELRRTQRRCNALSKIAIPDRRAAIAWISTLLEERERESLAILRQIRDQAAARRAASGTQPEPDGGVPDISDPRA